MKKNVIEKLFDDMKESDEICYLGDYEISSSEELSEKLEAEMISACEWLGLELQDEEWLEGFKCITKNIKERLRG